MKLDLQCKFVICCGRRGCGKSTLLKDLVSRQRHLWKEIFLICPSSFNNDWKGIVPDPNILTEYSEAWVKALISKMAAANNGKTKSDKGFKQVCLILDDVLSSDVRSHHSDTLRILAARGRHLGICCICTQQYLLSASPTLRNNADYLILGKQNTQSVGIVYEEFNLMDMNEKTFRQFYELNTNSWQFLLIDNAATNTSDIQNVYGRIKAEEKGKVQIKKVQA